MGEFDCLGGIGRMGGCDRSGEFGEFHCVGGFDRLDMFDRYSGFVCLIGSVLTYYC